MLSFKSGLMLYKCSQVLTRNRICCWNQQSLNKNPNALLNREHSVMLLHWYSKRQGVSKWTLKASRKQVRVLATSYALAYEDVSVAFSLAAWSSHWQCTNRQCTCYSWNQYGACNLAKLSQPCFSWGGVEPLAFEFTSPVSKRLSHLPGGENKHQETTFHPTTLFLQITFTCVFIQH